MKIETKFNVKDTVFFIHCRKIAKGTIKEICVEVSALNPKGKVETDVKYHVWNGASVTMLSESMIFATIDELTASLVGEYEKGAKR